MKRLLRRTSCIGMVSVLVLGLLFGLLIQNKLAAQSDSQANLVETGGSASNLATGKSYVFSPSPTYVHCSDPDDTAQLTDGRLTEGYFWTQKGCVGWQSADFVTITVDLGKVEPIQGASFRTAAGVAGVAWPASIGIAVSDDGQDFRLVADLVELTFKEGNAWPEGYQVCRLATDKLHTRGRFVRFVIIPNGSYVFCDEVEVFLGLEAWLGDEPGGEPLGDVKQRVAIQKMKNGIRNRYASDVAEVRKAVNAVEGLDESCKKTLQQQVTDMEKRLQEFPMPNPDTFRTILPYNDAHAELFSIQAALWKSQGLPPLSATVVNPWDPSELFGKPMASGGTIEVHSTRGEYRAAAIDLANSTDRPMTVRLSIEGLPDGPVPRYLSVAEVPWTDTDRGKPVMAALPVVEPDEKGWTITVLPGLVRQVWFTFHTADVADGQHQGQIVFESDAEGTEPQKIPVTLTVYPVDFPSKTTLELGGWSYTNGRGAYGMTEKNRLAFLRHLQEHFVNAPWANSGVLMSFQFDENGEIQLDTRQMDDWLAQWPEARQYYVFLNLGGIAGPVQNHFAGTELGTPEFNRRVGTWIHAWVEHLRTKGIEPSRLGILFFDEPNEQSDAASLIKWFEATKAAEPEIKVWLDPIYVDPTKASLPLFAACDILCPNRPMWLANKTSFDTIYREQQRQGRVLQFYSCSGPARLLDPYSYYRLQAWHCWKIGATGSFFWAYGDNSNASSWNEYLSSGPPFTPLFLDPETVTAGKQMEAIRESVEDFETFCILQCTLQQAKATGRQGPILDQAQTLLETATDEVLNAENVNDLYWHGQKDRSVADAVRVKILKMIAELQKKDSP